MLNGLFSKNNHGKDPTPSFIEKVEDYPHLRIVHLTGDIDNRAMEQAQAFLKDPGRIRSILNKSVVLDLRKVKRVDTAAIAGLIKVLSQLKQKNFRLAIMNAPDTLRDQLEILKLDRIVSVFDSGRQTFNEILAWSEEWK